MLIRHLKMRRNPTGGCVLIMKTEYIHATFVSKHGGKNSEVEIYRFLNRTQKTSRENRRYISVT